MAKRCQVSFDFSERIDPDYLARVCPYVTYAFFSGSHMTQEEIEALMDRCHALGTKVVGVTLGSRGSIFSEEGKRYHQGIVPVEAIDTMGAGDSFIAGFLTRRILGDGMEDALRFAATATATVSWCVTMDNPMSTCRPTRCVPSFTATGSRSRWCGRTAAADPRAA